jgi:hypothetical protein
MSWQSVRHPIHDEADGTHFYMRAEEWPFAGEKSGPVRFWVDADFPPALCPPMTMARYLLSADRVAKTIRVEHKIDYEAETAILARHDWSENPQDFAALASPEAANAVHAYVFQSSDREPPT